MKLMALNETDDRSKETNDNKILFMKLLILMILIKLKQKKTFETNDTNYNYGNKIKPMQIK